MPSARRCGIRLNFGLDRQTALSDAAAASGAVLEQALLDAAQTTELMMVSLSDRKVYIGFVRRISDPGASTRELALLPVISGYRDEQTLVFKPTTYTTTRSSRRGQATSPSLTIPRSSAFVSLFRLPKSAPRVSGVPKSPSYSSGIKSCSSRART